MQKILSYMRKAIDAYNMIEENDKIAVAVSGGKDSLTMLKALKNLQIFYPKKFEIIAITVNPGFEFFNTKLIEDFCKELNIPLFIENTYIKQIVFDERKEKNPCSLCANLRRGILNSVAQREGCTKIALGHNEDDVLETFLLNLLYTGTIHTFAPVTYMDRSQMTVIRPLIYAPEKDIRKVVRKYNITVMNKACPMDGKSKREDMKNMIKDISLRIPNIRANLMGAIKRSSIKGWAIPNNDENKK